MIAHCESFNYNRTVSIKRKRLIPILFVLVIAWSAVLSILPSPKASAAAYSANNPSQTEYIQWRAYRAALECIEPGGNSSGLNLTKTGELMDYIFSNANPGNSSVVGGVYIKYTGHDDSTLKCTSEDDMFKHALNFLGIDNVREFAKILKDESGTATPSKQQAKDALKSYAEKNKLAGRGASGVWDLRLGSQFWYWNEVYRMPTKEAADLPSDFASCGGILSNDSAGSDKKVRIGGSGSDPFYYYTDNGNEYAPADYTYAFYELDTGRTIDRLDALLNTTAGTNQATCAEIARSMTKGRRDLYIDILNKARAENPAALPTAPTPGSGGADGLGEDEAECLAQGSTIGWVMCPIYNLIADTTTFFYEQVLQPLLKTEQVDVRPGTNNQFYQAWSTFRFYGNMFLVIAMIIIVFGQSIGGGLIDAYTAKKVMPRIIAAAIMINLSIYIIALMIDVTNIIGVGIASLITAPFGGLSFTISTTQVVTAAAGGLLGVLLGGGTVWGFVSAAATGGGVQIAIFIALTAIVPALLAILAVAITLVIRRGLIYLLILVSPVALALYVLPNTEKYFKKWWDLLFKALLVYPIVMSIQAIANVMSLMVLSASDPGSAGAATGASGAAINGLAGLIALFMQIIPLFLIPFAFKMAGGAIGGLYAAIQGGSQKAGGLLKNRQEVARKDANSLALQARQRSYGRLGEIGDRNRFIRPGTRFLQNRVGGHDLFAALAADTAERFKTAEAIKDTGIDDELRALTVNKAWALESDRAALQAGVNNAGDSIVDGNHVRIRGNRRQFRTLGGRWVSEDNVDQAAQRWHGNMPMMQWALGYEMSKAASQEEMDYLYNNFGRLNEEGSGLNLSDGQMGGMWTGAAFAKQNADRQYKHYAWSAVPGTDQHALRMSGVNMMKEIDERQGNWAMMSQSADTWTSMSEEVNRARRILDGRATADEQGQMSADDAREVLQRGARIARSLSGGSFRDPETGRLVEGGIGQGASGRTKEEIENYAALFDPNKIGRDDYVREVGTERRGTGARSGNTHTPPPTDPATGLPVQRPASQTGVTGVRVDAPNPTRNNPRA